MSTRVARDAGHRAYSKRRIFLLATVAALSGGLLFAAFALDRQRYREEGCVLDFDAAALGWSDEPKMAIRFPS